MSGINALDIAKIVEETSKQAYEQVKVFLCDGDRLSSVYGFGSVVDALRVVEQQVEAGAIDQRDGRGERLSESLGAEESADRLFLVLAGL